MPTYKFTEQAQHDLTQIIRYTLDTWGQHQATSYIDALEQLADSLAQAPTIAKQCPDIHEGLRCFPYESHMLYFVEAPHGITIVRVLHEGMNPALHLEPVQK